MAYKISKTDFFRKSSENEIENSKSVKENEPAEDKKNIPEDIPKAEAFQLGAAAEMLLTESAKVLQCAGYQESAKEVDKIRHKAARERFTIAVVGEFSRGKSTFINALLQKDILPVGNLPTTAVLTRIRYNQKTVLLAFNEKNKKVAERKLSQDSWDGLVAENFGGEDFKGTALVGLASDWLKNSNMELIDTPGAGDLNEARSKVLGDALLGCDGAIITVSAQAALSQSEKLFIEERLLTRKLPFLLLVITKLDLIPVNERAGIIEYVRNKLKGWGMNIPVYVPYEVEIPDSKYNNITGMDAVKREMESWIQCPERAALAETWVLGKTADIVNHAVIALEEKSRILEESNKEKREALISAKMQKLAEAELLWGDLKLQMNEKCTDCYQFFLSKVDGYADSITERLQYEAGHTNSPEKWWNEDFPYRVKVELTNMAAGLDNAVSRRIQEDVRWYSTAIEKTFKSSIVQQKQTIADKDLFDDFEVGSKIQFQDLDRQRNLVRIGSAVLSISGFMLFSALGFLPTIATMGIGTGTSIISEKIFKKKIEEQKTALKTEIARCIPSLIQEAMEESEKRLKSVYDDVIKEADKSEQMWLEMQKSAIENTSNQNDEKQVSVIHENLSKLKKQLSNINAMILG